MRWRSRPCSCRRTSRARRRSTRRWRLRRCESQELALAQQIIASLEAPFDPAALKSEYRSSLRELLKAKLEGHELETDEQPGEAEKPLADLMDALLATVSAAGEAPAKKPSSRSKRAARART